MEFNSLPLVRASSVISQKETVFHTLDREVLVEAPAEFIREFISLCDGTQTLKKILYRLKQDWNEESVKGLLDDLFRKEVIVDARSLSDEVWKAVENPMRFPTNVTSKEVDHLMSKREEYHGSTAEGCEYLPTKDGFVELLKGRRSVRQYSGELAPLQAVIDMLWSAYGEHTSSEDEMSHRTCPSAGALYPLLVHVVLFQKTEDLQSAVYRVKYSGNGRLGFKFITSDTHRFKRSFLNPAVLNGSHGVIVISGSFFVTGEKYGNRSLLYVPLEAGHSAQNVMLQATEHQIATVEIGGFIDELLTEAISLPKGYKPLTTIVFGHEDQSSESTESLSPEIDWVVPMVDEYRLPFAIASARINPDRSWSHGRDPDPELALTKAVSEAKEWTACGCIPELFQASFSELHSVIDPRDVIRFHPMQYQLDGFPFAPFDKNREYEWTVGKDYITGEEVYILADLVYFPYFPETSYYAFANSSGCAAHPDRQEAIEIATLELIERDSFMNVYFAGLTLPTISEKTLPSDVCKRISVLQSIGFNVWVKDHSLDLAPVALVFAQSEELTFTTCASCASFDKKDAIRHALMEVEASVLARLQNGRPKAIKPHEVGAPLDHGRLYSCKEYYRQADFLVEGGGSVSLQEMGGDCARSWEELLSRLNDRGLRLVTVQLNLSEKYGGDEDLHIVRSIVPGLIPMTFGYRQEPAGMERIYTIAQEVEDKNLAYEDLVKFPHPFE